MTDFTPQGREKRAGERARELAAQLDLLEYGPEHRGFYDIEGATKLIERALAAGRLEGERQGKANAHANALHDYFASMKELDFDWIEYHRAELALAGELLLDCVAGAKEPG